MDNRYGKYSQEFKKKVVRDRIENALTVKETSARNGVTTSSVCIWTNQYREEVKKVMRRKPGQTLKVVRPTSGSAYVTWEK